MHICPPGETFTASVRGPKSVSTPFSVSRAPLLYHAEGTPPSISSVSVLSLTIMSRRRSMNSAPAVASEASPDVRVPAEMGSCSSSQVPSGVAWFATAYRFASARA